MLPFCTRCWAEISSRNLVCPQCGSTIDTNTSVEEQLTAALQHPMSEARARICWLLGQKRATWAIPYLLQMLDDSDLFVQVAALRALGEIGDPSVISALENSAADDSMMIRIVAQGALEQIRARRSLQEEHTEPRTWRRHI